VAEPQYVTLGFILLTTLVSTVIEPLTKASIVSEKNKPVHEIRLGNIKAAIWKNSTENGSLYNATLRRIYKKDDEWKSTDSFGRDDLLLVGKVADLAQTWIFNQK
jgi:hypothetical protein